MLLFFRQARGQMTGLIVFYADDTRACGDSSFLQLTAENCKIFEVKPHEYERMRFSGFYFERSDNGFYIRQRPYIDCLKPLPSYANCVLPRRYRA